jgi:hypothetical protein
MQRNAYLRSRQVKNFATAVTRPKSVYGLGTTQCKVPVAKFTVQRFWAGLKSSVHRFWFGNNGVFQDDWQGQRIPYFKSLSKCFLNSDLGLAKNEVLFLTDGSHTNFHSTTTGGRF